MIRFAQFLRAAWTVLWARLFEPYRWHAELIAACERLGGVYIKFIQMLAVHETTKHLVEGVSADLAYEHVPYEPIDLRAELGVRINQFSSVDEQPFAGGSYGQVYHARLLDGQEVIIKILRPSIRRTLRQDLRILNRLATVASWFTRRSVVNLRGIAHEFSHTTINETDYRREAANAEWQRNYFAGRDTVFIPRTYARLGNGHILVQDYVGGISLAEAMSQQRAGKSIDWVVYEATGSNIWQQLNVLGEEFLSSLLYADYQMSDPHPGNIRLLPDNKVSLIDFGMVSPAPNNRGAIVNAMREYVNIYEDRFDAGAFATAMLAFFDVELHDALQIVAREATGSYMSSLETFIHDYFQSQTSDSQTRHLLTERRVNRLFDQVINRGNKLGIKLSQVNIMQQRSMSMFLSVVREIGEAHDGKINFTLLHGITSRAYQQAIKSGIDQERQPEMSDERAFEVTADWLMSIAESDRRLYGFIMKGAQA